MHVTLGGFYMHKMQCIFRNSTFPNCRNNLSIFFLTSYHILEVQSSFQLGEDPDYEVSMKPKQSPLEAKFAIHAVIDSLYFMPHISHIFALRIRCLI